MKLRSRFEHFLAKIAGRDVDIGTLTPPVPVNATEELMLEIAGKQLPEVTEDDEGKVLKVVDGEWDKGEAGGSGEFLVVNFTVDVQTGNLIADKTFEEIKNAGYKVIAMLGATALSVGDVVENESVSFNAVSVSSSMGCVVFSIKYLANNTVSYSVIRLSEHNYYIYTGTGWLENGNPVDITEKGQIDSFYSNITHLHYYTSDNGTHFSCVYVDGSTPKLSVATLNRQTGELTEQSYNL